MDKYKNKMRYIRGFNEGFNNEDYEDIVDILSIITSYKRINKIHLSILNGTLEMNYSNTKNKNCISLFTHNDNKDSIEYFLEHEDEIYRKVSNLGYTYRIIRIILGEYHYRFIIFMNDDEILKLDQYKLKKFKIIDKNGEIDNYEGKIEIVGPKYYQTNLEDIDILLDNDNIRILKPKTYNGLLRCSIGTNWDVSFANNKEWASKNISKGSYYGGYYWYKSKTIKTDINSWWRKLLKLPKKQVEKVVKEFVEDFPRYIFYIIEFKRFNNVFNKLLLRYDLSRDEYGATPTSSGLDSFGYLIDAAHNNLKIWTEKNKVITLRYIKTQFNNIDEKLFGKSFHIISYDYDNEKEKIYDVLGFWADEGGEYKDNALYFLRPSSKDEDEDNDDLDVVKKNDFTQNKYGGSYSWRKTGKYNDPDWEYGNMDMPNKEREVPSNYPNKFIDFMTSIRNNVDDLKNKFDSEGWKL